MASILKGADTDEIDRENNVFIFIGRGYFIIARISAAINAAMGCGSSTFGRKFFPVSATTTFTQVN